MTELQFYRFITENNIEWHRNNDDSIYVFIEFHNLNEFHTFLCSGIFDEEGIVCNIKDGYIAIDIVPILEYYDIEVENVFKKGEE